MASAMAFKSIEEAPKLVLSSTCDRKGSNKIAPFNGSNPVRIYMKLLA